MFLQQNKRTKLSRSFFLILGVEFMESGPAQLTMEQQFKLQVIREEVKSMSKEEAQHFVVELFQQMMAKENMFKYMITNA
jgi:hypothetical protein